MKSLIHLLIITIPLAHALRGVHPSNVSNYNSITCYLRDSPDLQETLSMDRINDDYCDCLDGSDEPGTSACPDASFWCLNKGYRPIKLPSAWVGDGHCDCCDGSDEPEGQCANSCAKLQKLEFGQAKEQAAIIKQGAKKREKYAKEAEKEQEKDKREITKLEKELKIVKMKLTKSEKRLEGLKKRLEHEQKLRKMEEDFQDRDQGNDHDHDDEDDEHFADDEAHEEEEYDYEPEDDYEDLSDDDDGLADDLNAGEHQGTTADDNLEGDHKIVDGDESVHEDSPETDADQTIDEEDTNNAQLDDQDVDTDSNLQEEDEQEHEVSQESGTPSSAHSESSKEQEVDAEQLDEMDVDSVCADLETKGPNPFIRTATYLKIMILSKLQKILPSFISPSKVTGNSNLEGCKSKADNARRELDRTKSDLENKIKSLREKMTIDYGPDNALRKLHGNCVKKALGQYEYELCPFDRVRQYEHGSAIAVLGKFKGWNGAGKERKMMYKDGDRCWNGPKRSIEVNMVCGSTENIVSVEEPNRCSYSLKLETPAVCESAMADEILAPFKDTDFKGKEEL